MMAEPEAIWSHHLVVTDNAISTSQNVIISFGIYALQTVVRRIDEAHKLVAASPVANAVIDHQFPAILSDILFHQGLASLILFSGGQRRKNEKDHHYKSRIERAAYASQKCASCGDLKTLKDRKLRNAVVHLDEYLVDELSVENTGWFVDVAVKTRSEFRIPPGLSLGFCRSYIMDTDTIVHLGFEAKLSDLRRDCVAVLKALSPPAFDLSHSPDA